MGLADDIMRVERENAARAEPKAEPEKVPRKQQQTAAGDAEMEASLRGTTIGGRSRYGSTPLSDQLMAAYQPSPGPLQVGSKLFARRGEVEKPNLGFKGEGQPEK